MQPNDALGDLLARAREFLTSLTPELPAPFTSGWQADPQRVRDRDRERVRPAAAPICMAVVERLAALEAAAAPAAQPLTAALRAAAAALSWRQTYTQTEMDAEFLRNYAWTELIGRSAPFHAEHLACGFLLLGPHTLYPPHRHPADELYVPLSGSANWQQGDGVWRVRPTLSIIVHASEEVHAMHTADHPLLALYLWRGRGLDHKARLHH